MEVDDLQPLLFSSRIQFVEIGGRTAEIRASVVPQELMRAIISLFH
ncbi:MAG: hypothetical protein ACETWC_01300 [Acidobacteriota bacterium]